MNVLNELTHNVIIRWNKLISSLLVQQNYHKCQAINLGNFTQCNKLTTTRYCYNHYRIYKEYCRLYHIYHLRKKYSNVPVSTIAKVEHELRNNFEIQFNLQTDEGHSKWKQFLRNQFEDKKEGVWNNNNNCLDTKTINDKFDYLNLFYDENRYRYSWCSNDSWCFNDYNTTVEFQPVSKSDINLFYFQNIYNTIGNEISLSRIPYI